MRITKAYLDQLLREAERLDFQAAACRANGELDESRRLANEAVARRARIQRLQSERTEGVRFA